MAQGCHCSKSNCHSAVRCLCLLLLLLKGTEKRMGKASCLMGWLFHKLSLQWCPHKPIRSITCHRSSLSGLPHPDLQSSLACDGAAFSSTCLFQFQTRSLLLFCSYIVLPDINHKFLGCNPGPFELRPMMELGKPYGSQIFWSTLGNIDFHRANREQESFLEYDAISILAVSSNPPALFFGNSNILSSPNHLLSSFPE